MLELLYYVTFLSFISQFQAQITWEKVAQWNSDLPNSVSAYHTNQIWGQVEINASYCIFDLTDPTIQFEILYNTTTALTLPEWVALANQEGKDVLMISNAGYFDMETNQSIVLVIDDNEIQSLNVADYEYPIANGTQMTYYPTIASFGIYQNNSAEATWTYNVGSQAQPLIYSYPKPSPNCFNCTPLSPPNQSFPNGGSSWNPYRAVGSGPMLIKDGYIDVTWNAEMTKSEIAGQTNPRTAICVDNQGRIIVVVVDGRESRVIGLQLWQLAELMQTLDCQDAINLDGGGSTAMIIDNIYLANHPSSNGNFQFRPVPTVLMLTRKMSQIKYDKILLQN